MSNTLIARKLLGTLALVSIPSLFAFADARTGADALKQISNPKFKIIDGHSPLSFQAFTARDLVSGAPMTVTSVSLPDGRIVPVNDYLAELNAAEFELNRYGFTLRQSEDQLGTVAKAESSLPVLKKSLPQPGIDQANARWGFDVDHELASIKASGYVNERNPSTHTNGVVFDRTTVHQAGGSFMDRDAPAIAQVIQRIVRVSDGSEQKETQIYINGRQIFRRGNVDTTEARIWTTAFDIPLKEITLPIGPASVEAKLGIRGQVNLDLELNPSNTGSAAPQFSLNFKPQIVADGYVATSTSPTNIGDAGIEGAITLTNDTLNVNGLAALRRNLRVEMKEITVDNIFEGFAGRVYGYANVALPGRGNAGGQTKRFEKEFYAWNGVKAETRLYQYKAPTPQPVRD